MVIIKIAFLLQKILQTLIEKTKKNVVLDLKQLMFNISTKTMLKSNKKQ